MRVIYDSLASGYDEAMRPLERWLLRRLRAQTLAALPASGRVLEVGCGTGLNFAYYPPEARVVASELSTEMLKRARDKERPAHVALVQARVETLPFPDDFFDAAFATLLFCSVASPQKSFTELRRVVRDGGTVALLEHVRPRGILGLLFDVLNVFSVALFDDHFNRRTALEARRAGFQVQSVEPHAFGIINVIVLKKESERDLIIDSSVH